MIRNLVHILLICLCSQHAFSQISIGEWRDHLPYNQANIIIETKNKIVCATSLALFHYRKNDGGVSKLSKINGLSDIKPSALAYKESKDIIIVAYENANIDIIVGNTIVNINDIKNKIIRGDKTIYDINIYDNQAYLSCGFGIVVLDIDRKEIKDTYYIGENASDLIVYSTVVNNGYIYAATEQGIFYANIKNSKLADYKEWEKVAYTELPKGKYNSIVSINSQILVNYVDENSKKTVVYGYKNSQWTNIYSSASHTKKLRVSNNNIFIIDDDDIVILNENLTISEKIDNYDFGKPKPNDCIKSKNGIIYIADENYGLIAKDRGSFQKFVINSPMYSNVVDIDAKGDKICVAGAGKNAAIYEFYNENWHSNILTNNGLHGFVKVLLNPANPNQVYAASRESGLALFEKNQLSVIYNIQNSTLQNAVTEENFIKIGGIAIDNNQNLYVTNSAAESPISVKTAAGKWYSYKYPNISGHKRIGKIINTQYRHKWVQLGNKEGIFAFDDNNTFNDTQDDRYRLFSLFDANGNVETNEVLSMAEDDDGAIWVGTNRGVLTYFNPQNVFSGENFYADRIKVVDNSKDTLVQYLLAKERITAIAIDGANRKWFGTENSGVFLMSEDGKEEIFHFTSENSKLISNTINAIAVQENTGEVFFGTSEGIVSFKGTATKGKESFDKAYAYPNPVRENYDGNITIAGLVKNVNVKITDVSGQLVYETTAFGGQAIWNGKNYAGKRVQTGVYLIFCTDEQGEQTKVLKLLVIN